MKFYLAQINLYRKFKGGTWINVLTHLPMSSFWCRPDEMPKCCGAWIADAEYYGKK